MAEIAQSYNAIYQKFALKKSTNNSLFENNSYKGLRVIITNIEQKKAGIGGSPSEYNIIENNAVKGIWASNSVSQMQNGSYSTADHQAHLIPQNLLALVLQKVKDDMLTRLLSTPPDLKTAPDLKAAPDLNTASELKARLQKCVEACQTAYPWLPKAFNLYKKPDIQLMGNTDEEALEALMGVVVWHPLNICSAPIDLMRLGYPGDSPDYEAIEYIIKEYNSSVQAHGGVLDVYSGVIKEFTKSLILRWTELYDFDAKTTESSSYNKEDKDKYQFLINVTELIGELRDFDFTNVRPQTLLADNGTKTLHEAYITSRNAYRERYNVFMSNNIKRSLKPKPSELDTLAITLISNLIAYISNIENVSEGTFSNNFLLSVKNVLQIARESFLDATQNPWFVANNNAANANNNAANANNNAANANNNGANANNNAANANNNAANANNNAANANNNGVATKDSGIHKKVEQAVIKDITDYLGSFIAALCDTLPTIQTSRPPIAIGYYNFKWNVKELSTGKAVLTPENMRPKKGHKTRREKKTTTLRTA